MAKPKESVPGAIEFAQKEQAVDDSGLEVVLSYWDDVLETKQSFGNDQALIYSFSKDNKDIYRS